MELATLQSALHLRPQIARPFDLLVHQRLIEPHLSTAALLCAVQSEIGILQQRVRVDAVGWCDRDAERCPDAQRATVVMDRLLDERDDPFALRDGVCLRDDVADHRELVATQPGHDPGCAEFGVEPLCHPCQQRIAGQMPERVVDLLEPVQIDPEDGEASITLT